MKQEALAQVLGTNQQAVSAMENSETIDEDKLFEVAKALSVTRWTLLKIFRKKVR